MLELISEFDVPDEKIIRDVEREFMLMMMQDNEVNRKLMLEIDQAKYLHPYDFIDRLGRTLPIKMLSTGCKAGIIVAANPDTIVDTVEAGYNARDAIIRNVRKGRMILYYDDIAIACPGSKDCEIDVLYSGIHFASLNELNDYLMHEAYVHRFHLACS